MLVLDVGIGSEPHHIRNWFNMKGTVVGIDIRSTYKPEVVCDAQNLPFQNNVFDVVTASEVLEHMPNAMNALKEWKRVLKPNCHIYITVPNGGWTPALLQLFKKKENASVHPEHFNSWDCAHLKQLLEYAGFKVVLVSFFSRDSGSRRGVSVRLACLFSCLAPSILHSNMLVKAVNRKSIEK